MANSHQLQQKLALTENASPEEIHKFAFTSLPIFQIFQMFFSRKSASSTSSSSSSSLPSSPSAPIKQNGSGSCDNLASNRGQFWIQKKLTRQRKLRHVSFQDLGLQIGERLNSLPASPESARKSWSPGGSGHWPSSPVPQPLPLPELPLTRRPDCLGSPEEKEKITDQIAKKPSNYRPRFSRYEKLQNCNDKSLIFNSNKNTKNDLRLNITARSAPSSNVCSPAVSPRRSNAEDLFPSSHYHRRLSHELNVEGVGNKLGGIASPRSAPTSGFASPAVSPQPSDFLPSYLSPQEFQVHMGFEIPALGKLSTHVHDQSPLHSPTLQSPHLNPKSHNKFSFPWHHTLPPGSPKEWSENNGHFSTHPLPLPPGAMPSSSVVDHNTAEKLNASSRKTQWQKGKLIGRGTYGSVYIGTNLETGASCAIKEVDIIPDDPKSIECIKQLEQEIRVLSKLKHDNIVQYYGSEVVDDHLYIYLEYVHPGSLSKYVQEHCGTMTESIVRNFTRHILSGLAYLHSTKTIHRDIKGANLLVDSSGVVKLADFGMAKHLTGLSYQLSLKGSPHWMAPEVLKAAMQKDAKPDLAFAVDIWSLGCTIIEMFTGKPPWGELEGPQAMFKVLNRSPPIPEKLSPEGKDFLSHCLQRNPADRPSAAVLLDHLFVRHSNDPNMATGRQDQSQSPKAGSGRQFDLKPTSPARSFINSKVPSTSEITQCSSNKLHNCGAASNQSAYSTIEVSPSPSTMQLVQVSRNFSSPPNASSSNLIGAKQPPFGSFKKSWKGSSIYLKHELTSTH